MDNVSCYRQGYLRSKNHLLSFSPMIREGDSVATYFRQSYHAPTEVSKSFCLSTPTDKTLNQSSNLTCDQALSQKM